MKFRLDAQHYIHDRLLEPGTIIGDGTDVPMVLPNGDPVLPSVNMTPLDEEAKAAFAARFPGARPPERDPTKAIPLRGSGDTAKAPPLIVEPKKEPEVKTIEPVVSSTPGPAAPAKPAEKK